MKSFVFISLFFFMTGCTLSMQVFDTHGTATDLMDETQSVVPTASPTLTPGI